MSQAPESPGIFESIAIQGFRRLHDVKLKLQPLNVVIGANGSGKTSLLDVFSFLAATANGRLKESMSALGGIESNLTNLLKAKSGKSRFMAFSLAVNPPGKSPLSYRIAIAPRGLGQEVSDEVFSEFPVNSEPYIHIENSHGISVHGLARQVGRTSKTRKDDSVDSSESTLSQIATVSFEAEDLRDQLSSSTHYHVLDVSRRAPIRLPQMLRDARLPGHDGEDLVSCLYTMRETDPDRFEAIEATLRAGFPGFERLNFPPVAAGTLALAWKDRTSKQPFYMHQLSEGTLRFLWLTTLLHSPGLTAITMIDEPEVSLHPELLSLLADLMREASLRTQLIVATHADRLIRFLKPAEVVTINLKDDGTADLIRADELDLDQWLEDYTMDEVWRMGRLGARS